MTVTSATGFSAREVPWMKLGQLKTEPVSASEAAKLSGLDFEVFKADLSWSSGEHDMSGDIPSRKAIVRGDTGQVLGVMSRDYPLLQYAEAFDFMDTVQPTYVAAGTLRGGRQGFMVVRAPDAIKENVKVLNGQDPHDLYAVLRTSHDGSRAVEVSVMPLRNRCMNQLSLNTFTKGVPHRWSVPHTSSMHAKLAEAQQSLKKLGEYAQGFSQVANQLVKIKLTDTQATTTLREVLPDRPKRDDKIEHIISSWHTAETVGFDWTGWGLVNAVSEYFDWGRDGGTPESRFLGALQGSTRKTVNQVAARLLTRV